MGRRDVQTLEMITLKLLPRRGDLWESVMSDTGAMRGPPGLKPGAEESIPYSSSMGSDGVQVVLNKSSLFPFALSEVFPSHHQIKALRHNDKFNCFWCAFGMFPNWARWRSPKHFPFLSVKMDLTNSSAQLSGVPTQHYTWSCSENHVSRPCFHPLSFGFSQADASDSLYLGKFSAVKAPWKFSN